MAERLRALAGVIGVFAFLVGATALLGWVVGNELLKGGFVSGITVKTNTSICILLSGLALILLAADGQGRLQPLVRGLGLAVAGLGGATLLEHVSGLDLRIDQLLFREPPGLAGAQSPNRMGPPASVCFTLLGLGFTFLAGSRGSARTIHQKLALAVMLISSVSILGYLFHVRELYGIARYSGIAFLTAVSLFLLALGTLCVRPEAGLMRRFIATDSGALLTRRLLPAAIVLPVGLMLLRIAGQEAGLYDAEFGRAIIVLSFIVVFTVVIWQTGLAVSRQERLGSLAEAELKRRLIESLQALREADRRKDNFLAILAHELRNPLAPVRNAVHLLSRKKSNDPEVEWACSLMDRQLRHFTTLIDDLLDVSRLTKGRLQLRRSPLHLNDVIEAAVESIEPIAKGNGHHFAVNVPDEPLVIDGDSVRLTQIFTNLLSNAFKYTPPGGRVRLSAERLEHDVVVRVTDDGDGIGPEHLPHVFEMFYRKETPMGMAQGGLGIGLALVRHLVALHGGSVDARSDGPGEGSEFTVRLPLAADGVVVPSPETENGRDPRIAGRRVLVVDDNKDAAQSLAVLLAHAGASIFTAEDGEEAISIAARVRPDIVLLDIGLPKMNGYDVALVIRGRLGSRVKLIAVTGWGQEGDRERSKQAGFDHHLIKPVSPEALLKLMQDLDGSTADETEPREPFPA